MPTAKQLKMSSPQEKAMCVRWFFETKSVITVQRNYRRTYGKDPPSEYSIRAWQKKFLDTGSVLDRQRSGRPPVSETTVQSIQDVYARSPRKSTRRASLQLNVPRSTLMRVLHKRLKLTAYKVQLLHQINPNDGPQRLAFASDMLERLEVDEGFLRRIMFSDEATFYVHGKVNTQNVRIWGSENPHAVREHVAHSPKVNVWCGLMHNRVIGPFFFSEPTVQMNNYLDMLQNFAVPQLQDLQPNVILQQDGAPPHWGLDIRDYLNREFPGRWIGRDGPIPWPPRSPDITPLDFFLWGYIKDMVYRERLSSLEELKQCITAMFDRIDPDMLERTWQELEYRLDVLRATKGAHVEVY